MISIDFLEPSPLQSLAEHVRSVFRWTRSTGRSFTFVVLALLAVCSVEGARVRAARQDASELLARRDQLAAALVPTQTRARLIGERHRTVLALLELRRGNALAAVSLAGASNSVGRAIGLISLRKSMASIELEGRSAQLTDVAFALDRLERKYPEGGLSLTIRRERPTSRYVWFRIGLGAATDAGTP